MRWSWLSFAAGALGGGALAALLWMTFADVPVAGAPRTEPDAPEADVAPPAEPEAAAIAVARPARAHVSPSAQAPRNDVPPPGEDTGRPVRFALTDGTTASGGSFRMVVSKGGDVVLRILSGSSRFDRAPNLLKWATDRAAEAFPGDAPVPRSEASSRLRADTYAERATGVGLALRARPVPLDLLLAAARDTAYPDLRGAALLAAAQAARGDDDVRAAVRDLALDPDADVRLTATKLLVWIGPSGAARAAEILVSGDYTEDVLPKLAECVAKHGDVAAFLGAAPPPDAALSVIQQLAGRLTEPRDDDDRRLAVTLPQLVRPLLDLPEADRHASLVLPQLAALGHGAFLRGVAGTPFYRPGVRSAAVTAALGEESTRPDGIAAAGAILTDPTADVALARGILGAVDDAWLDDPTLRGALEAAARSHPSAWVRDYARERLAAHDPAASGTIVVHDAKYGQGDSWVDVGDAVRGAISEGRLKIQASNDLGGDPKFGAHKTLRVEYSLGGERRLATVGEGGWLTIP